MIVVRTFYEGKKSHQPKPSSTSSRQPARHLFEPGVHRGHDDECSQSEPRIWSLPHADGLQGQRRVDDHHVSPSNYLEIVKDIKSSRLRDCILNRTLIDRTTNQIIGARAPSDYLAEIQKTPGFPFESVLASHCLLTGGRLANLV